MPEAVIVAAGRSPIGRAFKGSLVDWRPDDLGSYVLTEVLKQVPQLEPAMIDDLMCGCGLPGGEQGFNMGRVISVLARLDTPGCTITRYCSSSLQTTRMAYHAIKAGEGDVFLSLGVECVSRYGNGSSDPPTAQNPRMLPDNAEGYPDVYIAMGQTAENVAEREGISREEMDRYAVKSQSAAVAARDGGFFDHEIVAVPLGEDRTFTRDDGPRPGTTMEKLATLEPAFREHGRVTAGNACPLNDGAAAVVVMSDTRARELGIRPLARVVSTGVSALEPEFMGLGPIDASKQALGRAGMTIDDIDVVELNEAFAAQVIPSARGIGVDPFSDKLNPHGGAIALGHPFGMTGARILCTLLNDLRSGDQTYGLETMCVGGGQGMAMIVERLN
ncbi:MAG: acetyl-CoA C-acetyltransferase [Candidatus Dormibacteraeota bacterium]|nr:acetyl-CoA C-acetyltransferase [Candidatus Dormibacteraeota bacterium]MBO0705201.1 acetyl-CoA C-acetyltransferase [Candidatus Dormibacteraeota bacterium]MBO0762250.1 acetyl-CoA C-acetyltransferase [Candidatus Dormibacteraeota bacterium]